MEYQSQEIGELAKALSAAQGMMDAAKKDSKGNYGKYTTISSILEVVKDALSKNGLAVVQAHMPCEAGNISLRTTLMHSSGQWIASQLTMKAENVSPQKIGSVITYARRYALAALLGVGQEDDDAQSVQDDYEKRARKEEKQRVQQVREQSAANNPDPPSREMFNALMATLNERGFKEQKEYLAEMTRFFGRGIKSSKELTRAQVKEYLDACKRQDQENPF